ncbi:MAG: hypothetical protein Q4G70_07495 [Pseudomonadota bacterium]|nr:hypothetical protein [Pseudomonadota bacterium]
MSPMAMIIATDWLWPFVLAAMVLVALFTASLAWSAGSGGVDGSGARRRIWVLTITLPLAAMALYAALGNPRGLNPRDRHPVPDEAAETMVGKLAERLRAEPDNPAGWLMLARSYKVLQRYAESAEAWEHAKELAWDDVEAMSEWTEARILSQGQRFDRRSQELLARAMSLDANAPGVLMLRGLSALDRGDVPAAQKVLTQLRDQYAEGSLDRQALDAALAQLAEGRDPRVSRPQAPPLPRQTPEAAQ